MCAICGKVTAAGPPPEMRLIETMCELMRHRGPDGRGYYSYPRPGGPGRARVGLGHNRLSIIDLEGGAQPLSNEDGTVWVVLNGEIYNFVELRRDLEACGHTFRTNSDTEVIVHGYEEWGEDVVLRLNGMFAVGLFDERTETLLLIRDRLGVKPLFYAQVGATLVFASEIKALLADPDVPNDLDAEGLVEYLTFNYTLGPRTLLRAVRRLPPAHLLRWQGGEVHLREYWDVDLAAERPFSEREAGEVVRESLRRAVRRRLRSDVPLGAFLSGGIDSTVVVSLMAEQLGTSSFQVFTGDFRETSYSEQVYAALVARRYGLDHRTVVISPTVEDLIQKIVWFNDEPLGDSSSIPTYLLSEFTRRHVKVALSGDGGDEIFFGYETYHADQLFRLYRRLPAALRRSVIPGLVDRLPVSFEKISFDFKLRQFVAAGVVEPFEAHCSWRRIFSEPEQRALLDGGVVERARGFSPFETPRRYFDRYPRADFLTRCLYVDLRTWLADDMLVKVDRASMAHALEVRSPFLDFELVELVFSMPRGLKLRGLTKKYILKRAFADLIPAPILKRKKSGFNSPIGYWLRRELRVLVHDLLLSPRIRELGVFRPAPLGQMVEEFMRGERDHSHRIWGLLNLVLWYETIALGRRHAGVGVARATTAPRPSELRG